MAEPVVDTEAHDAAGVPAESAAAQSDDDFEQLVEWYKESRDGTHDWRQEAREAYDFVAGEQWNAEDVAMLREQLRPIITFNRVAPVIDSVAGLQIGNRQEVTFIPRLPGEQGANDLLTGAGKWVRDESEAEDEESDAFIDLVVCGMGWTETRLDYDEDPDGQLIVPRTDPMEMFWDTSSKRRNITDARFIFRVKDFPLKVARDMFPDASDDDLHASWADDTGANADKPHDAQQAPFYRNDQSGRTDKQRAMVRLVEAQWWTYEQYVRALDPFTRQMTEFSLSDWRVLDNRLRLMGMPQPT